MPIIERLINCERCEDEINLNTQHYYYDPNGNALCDSCFNDHYFTCEDCSGTFDNEDYSEDGMCCGCFDRCNESGNVINDCSYMPALQFHKEVYENTLYQGIELEIEVPDDDSIHDHARAFTAWLKQHGLEKFIYLKTDGSLDNGYEIVSHPFTSRARHKKLAWYKILNYLKRTGVSAMRNSTCGLHIHVSKDALTASDLMKLKLFFFRCSGRIQKVAGRGPNQYCEYQMYSLADYKAKNLKSTDVSRYLAVNVNNPKNQAGNRKNTVEFRVFKATLTWKRFIGCLQFTEAVCEFVKVHGAAAIDREGWTLFKAYIRKMGRWGHLEKHLKKVGA